MEIKVIKTCAELRTHVRALKKAKKTIGIVPTMGALHAGHLSLVERAIATTDETIVTIFVNPAQFTEREDLDNYPRTLEADCEKLTELQVSTVFAPSNEEMYPPGCTTFVEPAHESQPLEGEFRPIHFRGVATIVLKLLNLTRADKAFFGQKDFQQLLVVKKMVTDLNVDMEIISCPIVREADGLAMSSRNAHLSEEDRQQAAALSRALKHFENRIHAGERDAHTLVADMRQILIDGGVSSIDYAVVANPVTLQSYDQIEFPAVALIAAHVGITRLIDNCLIESPRR